MEIKINGLENIAPAAKTFIEAMGSRRIFAFNGAMGAGKTTFIAEVCRQLGADDDSGSPTFSIVNEYHASYRSNIYHFQINSLDSPSEAHKCIILNNDYSGDLCLIEWPDRIGNLLPEEAVEVDLLVMDDGSRLLRFN